MTFRTLHRSVCIFVRVAGCVVLLAAGAEAAEWAVPGDVVRIDAGITPGIAADNDRTVHVVYMRDGAIFHRQKVAGRDFGPAEAIPLPEGKANYNSPHVVCDPDGTVHVVFERDVTKASRKAWYTNRAKNAWKQPLLAIERREEDKRVNYPRVAVTDGTAWVSGFIGGGSTLVRIVDLHSTPRVTGRIDTALWVAHAFPRGEELLVVGRAGAAGHKLERYDAALQRRGEPLLLSRGTPTKTYEATAAIMDAAGTIHVVGAAGYPTGRLWYSTDRRARAGADVVLGPEFGQHAGENTYPVLCDDRRGHLFVSYRDNDTGEGRLTMLEATSERFTPPVVVAPATTRRLRWNPHLAPAIDGIHVAWDADGQVYIRTVAVARRGADR